MSTVYITETGVKVHKQGERLIVKRGSEILQDIPMIKVSRLVLMGKGINITTPTLFELTRKNVSVYYLTSNGRYIMRTIGQDHLHSKLRQAQVLASMDPSKALKAARSIVDGKINNQRVLVRRHSENAPWSGRALSLMDTMRRQVNSSKGLDELRGFEGMAAKSYFELIRKILHPPQDGSSWGFERRAYYPSTDPVNALLSFGYTLLLNDLIAACQISGLDPSMGFFHSIDYNKPSMALDLEEEFRPVIVDSIVLFVINRRIFTLRDFQVNSAKNKIDGDENEDHENPQKNNPEKKYPVYLNETSRKKFLELYERRVNEQAYYPPTGEKINYRRIFELQAYAMARYILNEADFYQPFVIR